MTAMPLADVFPNVPEQPPATAARVLTDDPGRVGMTEPTVTIPELTIHAHARDQHTDGSPMNVCDRCVHFDLEDQRGISWARVGWCRKNEHTNMWSGNCDLWWPI